MSTHSIPSEPGTLSVPSDFLWGAATAAHQIEGGNTNSDWWAMEHRAESPCEESSADADDSYHRYGEDMALLAQAGLTSYRFSIEWARIEPAQGEFSLAQLAHYRKMIDTALALGLVPMVTLHHFTSPQWFAERGGWLADDAVEVFLAYVARVLPILEGVPYVVTINEPNMLAMMHGVEVQVSLDAAGLPGPHPGVTQALIRAHHGAVKLVRAVDGVKVGWSIANQAYQAAPGCEAERDAYAYPREDIFLEASRGDDFIGVQAYLRTIIGKTGPIDHPDDVERTLTGWEYYPAALGEAIRHTQELLGNMPMIVTENGIATSDDARRIDYTQAALEGMAAAMVDGADVRGYLHWSLLDNFEWLSGFRPTFGLIAVDRTTFARTPKPSLAWLGEWAKRSELPLSVS